MLSKLVFPNEEDSEIATQHITADEVFGAIPDHRYKVWIEIEEVDAEGDHVVDHDPSYGACAEFDLLTKAWGFADWLYESSQAKRKMVKSPDGRFFWVTEVL